MKELIKKKGNNIYEIPRSEKMLVPGRIFVSDNLFEKIDEVCIQQIVNVAELPGIVKCSIAMSDVHVGYGFPIGGVAAFDLKEGVISPGGVGYDINCGVRLLASNLNKKEFLKKKFEILDELYKNIPSGVGKKNKFRLDKAELDQVLKNGIKWAISKGYGYKEDSIFCEDGGCMKGAKSTYVSEEAKKRGMNQLGTLGSGNHFLEVQEVAKIFDKKIADILGIKIGQIVVLIHSGSRGLGHQTASDYIRLMEEKYGLDLYPKNLASAPINSKIGKEYLGAMMASANFAFVNRQLITHQIRKSFQKYFPKSELNLVYDIAHNIAKMEEFEIDGKKKILCVHRKGAARSLGKWRNELPKKYREIGQPIFTPGSMGTSSYILVGNNKSANISFSSTVHGAGRILSRSHAIKTLQFEKVKNNLEKSGVIFKSGSEKGLVEEAPEVYKDVDEIVKISEELGISSKVAKLKPLMVIKG